MKKILLFLGMGLFALSSAAVAQSSANTQVAQAVAKSPFDGIVKFKKDTVNFGTTKLNQPATAKFEFTNTSKQPLIIQSAQPSCGCTIADWTKEPILPGKTGVISATYNAAALGKVMKTVFVNFKGISQTLQLYLTGDVVQ
jgi:hypothetical protein